MELCNLSDRPLLTEIPQKMLAFMDRQDQFGKPKDAWQRKITYTPEIVPLDVLIYVMSAGINGNNVWSALGKQVETFNQLVSTAR
jgi:crotonyl-CoA carboxylase/reductase